jgi:hypothetical protein
MMRTPPGLSLEKQLLLTQARAELLQARLRAKTPEDRALLDGMQRAWPRVLMELDKP